MNISTDVILLVIGIFVVVFGSGRLLMIRKIINNGVDTEALVVDNIVEHTEDGTPLHYPVVQFKRIENDDNSWIELRSSVGYYPAKYQKNSKVKVRFLKSDYRKFIIRGSNQEAWVMIILIFAGTGMALYYLLKVLNLYSL